MDHLLRRECSRAARNGRALSLVLFQLKSEEASLATYRLARTMLRRARMTDEIGWFDEEHLAALLPETSALGARAFAEGVRGMVDGRMPRPRALVYTYPTNWVMKDDSESGDRRMAEQRPISLENTSADGNRSLAREALPTLAAAGSRPGVGLRAIDDLLVMPPPAWKRAIDIVGAAIALTIFSPLMLLAAIAIKLSSPGPIIFAQRRAGLGGYPFTIYKFRTMKIDAESQKQALRAISEQDGPAFKLTNDPRITRIGHILRKTSIDELPQLWNVLKGDMSLVGPRPLPVDESAACELWQRRRLDVTPGLTCIWQVEGRSRVTFDEWVRMDVKYIRRRTIFADIALMFRTIPAVLLRRGAR
jgi:lipopolysaccharide/colanic/teichoic acid biosynthesis glycosyltransferase